MCLAHGFLWNKGVTNLHGMITSSAFRSSCSSLTTAESNPLIWALGCALTFSLHCDYGEALMPPYRTLTFYCSSVDGNWTE